MKHLLYDGMAVLHLTRLLPLSLSYSAFVYMFVKSNVSGGAVDNEGGFDETNSSTADLVSNNVQNKRKDILTFRRTPRPVSRGLFAFEPLTS